MNRLFKFNKLKNNKLSKSCQVYSLFVSNYKILRNKKYINYQFQNQFMSRFNNIHQAKKLNV